MQGALKKEEILEGHSCSDFKCERTLCSSSFLIEKMPYFQPNVSDHCSPAHRDCTQEHTAEDKALRFHARFCPASGLQTDTGNSLQDGEYPAKMYAVCGKPEAPEVGQKGDG